MELCEVAGHGRGKGKKPPLARISHQHGGLAREEGRRPCN